MYVLLALVVFIILVFIFLSIRSSREKERYQMSVDSFVVEIFSGEDYRPEVIAGWTYGVPSFTLRFENDADKIRAEKSGLTKQFLESVQQLCCDIKPRGEKFDANLAVAIFSKNDEERWVKEASLINSDRDNIT
jgi:hypothetical protein